MEIRPMFFGSGMKARRDAINVTVQKFYEWCKLSGILSQEISDYGTQTYQGTYKGAVLWYHEITFLLRSERDVDWNPSVRQIQEKWKPTDEYGRENELTYDEEQKTLPPLSMPPTGPRTEVQDRFNVQNQNNRSAKMGAKGTFTYEEWMLLRRHFGDVCGRCKRAVERPVIDHVIPLSRGGTNYIENIQTLCKDCNSGKGARSADYRDPELVLSFLEKLEELRLSS